MSMYGWPVAIDPLCHNATINRLVYTSSQSKNLHIVQSYPLHQDAHVCVYSGMREAMRVDDVFFQPAL